MKVTPRAVAAGLLLLAPIVLIGSVATGAVGISPVRVWSVVAAHLAGEVPADALADQIVWQIRAPRVLLALVAGAGLAVAGAVLQAVVRNPLADPYVLGVSSGASFAAVTVLTVAGVGSALGVSAAAFAGAVLALALVLLLGRRRGTLDPARLLLAGVALSYLFQAATTVLQLRVSSNQLAAVLFWLLGTVSGASWSGLLLPLAVVTVATGWLLGQARRLNALHLGDDAAVSLGLDVHRFRMVLLAVAAALTAAVIAVAGGVGFVGLVAPHAIRLLTGADHRYLLPLSALAGGLFLVLADLVGRTAAAPLELPLGVVTAFAGVPFFLLLLRRSGVRA